MQAKPNSEPRPDVDPQLNFNLSWKKGGIVSVGPTASVLQAARLMKDHQVGDVLVMGNESEGGGLLGIVTDRDLALCLAEPEKDLQSLRVSDIMSKPVVTCSEETDFFRLVSLMSQAGVTRLPLKDAKEKVVSIVTAKNLLEILVKSFFEVTQISERQRRNESTHH